MIIGVPNTQMMVVFYTQTQWQIDNETLGSRPQSVKKTPNDPNKHTYQAYCDERGETPTFYDPNSEMTGPMMQEIRKLENLIRKVTLYQQKGPKRPELFAHNEQIALIYCDEVKGYKNKYPELDDFLLIQVAHGEAIIKYGGG